MGGQNGNNHNAKEVVGEITTATLKSITGDGPPFRAAIKRAAPHKEALIPNHEHLLAGDVILSRKIAKNGNPAPSPIVNIQRSHGCTEEASYWTHAMIYAGNMFVVESQGYKTSDSDKPGVQVRPLTCYSTDHDLLILRYTLKGYQSDNRQRINRYALLRGAVGRTGYDWRTTVNSIISRKRWRPRPKSRTNCSEFITECYAVGGECLVKEYDALQRGSRFIFPAHFYESNSFDKFRPEYLKLID